MTDDGWRVWHEQNRRSWNAVTPVHNRHKRDQAAFLRDGGSTLFPDELELLGDPTGLRLVHLQCNSGQDSLSLAAMGAVVTGVDISDEAVEFARRLSADAEIPATFVRSDLFDWLLTTDDRFDVAFATYGCLGWLSDLDRWARGVARILTPGGRLVLLEFHPLAWSVGPDGLTGDSYFEGTPIAEENGVNDYVGEALAPSGYVPGEVEYRNAVPAVSFQWTTAQILQALTDAGFHLATVREYPHSNGCELFEGMRRIDGNRYVLPEGMAEVPLMLGVVAARPRSP